MPDSASASSFSVRAYDTDESVRRGAQGRQGTKVSVTLTLVLKDTAGNTKTVTKTVKLKRRY